ncbi:MAG TPA: hypothetical protein VGR25_08620, partial [bacterium]|nr:hypothetical protein [bacterium]
MLVFALLSLGLLAGSCHDTTGPSPIPSSTPPRPDILMITPGADALKLGSTAMLTSVVVSGDGMRRTVAASWSSDTPEVVAVGDDGRVRALSLGKATITARFETLTAAQPMRVVPDYEGTWSGEYRLVECTRLSGPGPDYCRGFAGAVLPLRTVLTQNGSTLSGRLELYSTTGRELVEAGPVQGSIEASGALVLTGVTSSVVSEQPGGTTLGDWNTVVAGDGDQMTGRFVKNRRFQ